MAEELGNAPHMPQEVCKDQKARTISVEGELKRFARRLERDRIAPVFTLTVYAFNCSQKHDTPPPLMHTDYVASGHRGDVPNGLNAVISSLEHALAHLKKKVQ